MASSNSREEMLNCFYQTAMPQDSCVCKQHINKWAACQRYQLQQKLQILQNEEAMGISPYRVDNKKAFQRAKTPTKASS